MCLYRRGQLLENPTRWKPRETPQVRQSYSNELDQCCIDHSCQSLLAGFQRVQWAESGRRSASELVCKERKLVEAVPATKLYGHDESCGEGHGGASCGAWRFCACGVPGGWYGVHHKDDQKPEERVGWRREGTDCRAWWAISFAGRELKEL